MALRIAAVGRLRAGAERALIDDYAARVNRIGRGIGFGPLQIQEVEPKGRGGRSPEASLLRAAVPAGAAVVALDERGRSLSSPDFAAKLASWRDTGRPAAAFWIGGADGLDPGLRASADLVLSFGAMVWPHMLARVMLAEQLYRAASILADQPYHRS
ncbi:MAG: 23S rRNA (pseudouridine(1915)-N(3))-methyltransferase RlmH [Pseudomonadota bacterium]